MAEIVAKLRYISGEFFEVENLVYMELTGDLDAACDGLRLRFYSKNELPEVKEVTLYIDGEKAFFGYCDKQEFTKNKHGGSVFIYARSSAALLVDNEANPATYNSPSTNVLFHAEAKAFGFKNKLPDLVSEHEYSVEKGTSCYGAVNQFVKTLTQTSIRVNCENELVLPDDSKTTDLDLTDITEFKKCVNRAAPVTRIDYKISAETPYNRHYKSRFCEGAKIMRTRKLNISSLPAWQREYTLADIMQNAAKDYYTVTTVIDGCHIFALNSRAKLSGVLSPDDNYRLYRTVATYDKSGEKTKLVFLKHNDLKEVSYVAE